ncbi:single-stranded DNA-binding protein [Breznakia pachnodae]|uniref:Single-stranded DNA-binding protein n=1 Tax=Breznakia pachnodae TaxID=265178 RepID=A0ABU0E8N7_9FIRM|nr:single-stranded DNA-binding protein [Breznakia pachnodae]MDQ0363250.1 single stranded DNA-binding protein [Breznakia pachnodae]
MLKVIAVGRLTADIRVQQVVGDEKMRVANFSLACRDGNNTEFADFTAWNDIAETLAKYTKKGAMIYIEGRQKTKDTIDKETSVKHRRVFTVVDKFEFLEGKKKDESLFNYQM